MRQHLIYGLIIAVLAAIVLPTIAVAQTPTAPMPPEPADVPPPAATTANPAAPTNPPDPSTPAGVKPADPNAVSFRRDVAPILVKHCQTCHGPEKAQNGYRVDTFARAGKPGENELPPLTPGKLDESEIYRLVASADKKERMPKDGDPLSKEQVDTIQRWIQQGAKFDGPDAAATLASYIPRVPHPSAPEAYPFPVPVTAAAFSPNGAELVLGGYHELTVWSAADGKLLRRVKNIAQRTHALSFSKDGALLAVASGTPGRLGEIKIVNPADGAEIKLLGTTSDEAFDVAFSPDGKKLAACGADRAIRIYDVASGKEERVIENHADWVMAVAWSPDGARLASASRDKTAKVFDVATGQLAATYSGHNETVYGVAFKSDGKQVFSSGRDNKIRVWNAADGANAGEIGFGGEVFKISTVGNQIFAPSADKTARQFKEDKSQVRSFAGSADWLFAVAVHPGAKRVAAGGYDGQVRVWNMDDGKEVLSFVAAPGYKK